MRPVLILAIFIALGALAPRPALPAPTAGSGDGVLAAMTPDLSDPDAVLRSLRDLGASELPAEALALYQEGIAAARAGNTSLAVTRLEQAGEMDPSFPEPYVALARIHLFKNPTAAVGDLWRAVHATTSSFGSQHLLLVNVVFGFFLVVALGGLLMVLYAGLHLLPRVHHTMAEILKRWFPLPVAALLAALVLLAPALWRVGLIPIVLLFGGLMWAWMDTGDRRWTATLAGVTLAAPLLLWVFSPVLYSPLDPAGTPFLLSRAMNAPYSPGLVRALEKAQAGNPEQPDIHFALGMVEKRGNRLDEAQARYEEALRFGAPEPLVYNNLGVIAFLRGDYDRAMGLFQRSITEGGSHAAPHYNLSQAYAKKLLFEKADQEMLEANKLSFNRIRAVLRNGVGGKENPLIDEPLPPSALWNAAWTGPRQLPGLPAWMTLWFPGTLALLPVISLPLFGLGVLVGSRLHRSLPSFECSNCGRAVCRRCLRRIRRSAYCTSCGDALLRIQSTAYSKLVLDSRLRRNRKLSDLTARAAAWLLPGYHASRRGHADLAATLAMGTALACLGLVHDRLPVTRLAWLENGSGLWWPGLPLALLAVVMGISFITVARLKSPPPDLERAAREEAEGTLDPRGHLAERRAA